ncbi:hypothetical protein NUSPORA_00191 [Nucleospora cyclopteri]
MNAKIHELLISENDINENYGDDSYKIYVRAISKPLPTQTQHPVIRMNSCTYFYTFDGRELHFETSTFVSGCEKIKDLIILREDKRYAFLLTEYDKIVFCDLANLENKTNFCRNAIQMVQTEGKMFFLVKKDGLFYVYETFWRNNTFMHKIVLDCIKEKKLHLIGTNGTFFLEAEGRIYDKNFKWNSDFKGDFVHQYKNATIIGNPKSNDYELKLFVEGILKDSIEISNNLKSFVRAVKNFIVVFSEDYFYILKVLENKIKQIDKIFIDFEIYNFDFHLHEDSLYVTVLTDKVDFTDCPFVVDLTDKNDPKTIKYIFESSSLEPPKVDKEDLSVEEISKRLGNLQPLKDENLEKIKALVKNYTNDNGKIDVHAITADISNGVIDETDSKKILSYFDKIGNDPSTYDDFNKYVFDRFLKPVNDSNKKVKEKNGVSTPEHINEEIEQASQKSSNGESEEQHSHKSSKTHVTKQNAVKGQAQKHEKAQKATSVDDRFQKYLNKSNVNENVENQEINLNQLIAIQTSFLQNWEAKIDIKIEAAIEKALLSTDLYKNLVLNEFVPKLESCMNEIRIQVLAEFKSLKTVLSNENSFNTDEFLNLIRNDAKKVVKMILDKNKTDFEKMIKLLVSDVSFCGLITSEDLILILKRINEESSTLDFNVFTSSILVLLNEIHLNTVSKENLQVFSSVLKALDANTKLCKDKNSEIFFLIKYFKKKIKQNLQNPKNSN